MIEIQELMVHVRFVDSVNPISSQRRERNYLPVPIFI
jgi:hypothetical protein